MAATILGAATVAIWFYLLVFHGGFSRVRPHRAAGRPAPACSLVARLVVVIPARNEAAVIGRAVASLLAQRGAGRFRIVVVDDHSSDGTAALARATAAASGAADRLMVVTAPPVPAGWTGKLWAVRQGIATASVWRPDYLLLTDADIEHAPGSLAELMAHAEGGGYDLVSLMVRLHCRSLWERLLIPAFVFFFFKLYPPRRVADRPAAPPPRPADAC